MVVTISIPGIGIIVIMIVIGHLDCQNTTADLWSDLLIISSTHWPKEEADPHTGCCSDLQPRPVSLENNQMTRRQVFA